MTEVTKPALSVLMAVYNEAPDRLDVAIASILDQSFSDFEFVILDDGSERADTLATLLEAEKRDARVRLFREPHRGFTRTLNVGISRCRAELVARQDSDDWSEGDRLEKQAAYLASHPDVAVLGGAAVLHEERGRELWRVAYPKQHDEIRRSFGRANPFCHGSVCFRKDPFVRAGMYREEELLDSASDYEAFWRLTDTARGANLTEVVYHYRITCGSMSTQQTEKQLTTRYVAAGLARMRGLGRREDYAAALKEAAALISNDRKSGALAGKQADRVLLSGDLLRGLRLHGETVVAFPCSIGCWGRFVRAICFALAPRRVKASLFGQGRSV